MKNFYRINCGSLSSVRQNNGLVWQADNIVPNGESIPSQLNENEFYSYGGDQACRENDLECLPREFSEILKSERYGHERYCFHLPKGIYQIIFCVAETFEMHSSFERNFSISINNNQVIHKATPFSVANGFARAGCIIIDGFTNEQDVLNIQFSENANLYGLEINESHFTSISISNKALEPQIFTPPLTSAIKTTTEKVLFAGYSAFLLGNSSYY